MTCPTCRAIFLGGARPSNDSIAHFASNTPRALLLYAGDFAFHESANATYLGAGISAPAAKVIASEIGEIAGYFEPLLGRPYDERPALLSFNAIATYYPPGTTNWQFVTWPTIAIAGGSNFDQLVVGVGALARVAPWLRAALNHEMAHYYFGTVRFPSGPLFWFGLESTAEYLALKRVRAAEGDAAYAERAAQYIGQIGNSAFPSLKDVTQPDQIGLTHRYRALPLALMELEETVGESAMRTMMQTWMNSSSSETFDLSLVRRGAAAAGISAPFDSLVASAYTRATAALVLQRVHRILARSAAAGSDSESVNVAVGLINADTSVSGRLRVLAALRRVGSRSTERYRALYQIGKISALTGVALPEGERTLQEYLTLPSRAGQPTLADAHLRLGMIAEHRRDLAGARAHFSEALHLNPSLELARQALARLSR